MIRKTASATPGHVRIVFELPSSVWAHRVSLIGEFNDWKEDVDFLTQDRDGHWRATLDLPVGHRYEFHYLIDGHNQIDLRADGLSLGGYGEQNSIVLTTLDSEVATHRNYYEPQTVGYQAAGYQRTGYQSTNRQVIGLR